MTKKPRPGSSVYRVAKVPRAADQPNVQAMEFCWRVSEIDWQGSWGWSKTTCEQLLKFIVPKLHSFESMTWSEVEGATGSHFVEVTAIVDDARRIGDAESVSRPRQHDFS